MSTRKQAIHARPEAKKSAIKQLEKYSIAQILAFELNDCAQICKLLGQTLKALPTLYDSYDYEYEKRVLSYDLIWYLFPRDLLIDEEAIKIRRILSLTVAQLDVTQLFDYDHFYLSLSIAFRTNFQCQYIHNSGMLLYAHVQMLTYQPQWQTFFASTPKFIFERLISQDLTYLLEATDLLQIAYDRQAKQLTDLQRHFYLCNNWLQFLRQEYSFLFDKNCNGYLARAFLDFLFQMEPTRQAKIKTRISCRRQQIDEPAGPEIYNEPTLMDIIWYAYKERDAKYFYSQ